MLKTKGSFRVIDSNLGVIVKEIRASFLGNLRDKIGYILTMLKPKMFTCNSIGDNCNKQIGESKSFKH